MAYRWEVLNKRMVLNRTLALKFYRDKTDLDTKCSVKNITRIIQDTLLSWQFSSDHDLHEIKADISEVIDAVKQQYFKDTSDFDTYDRIHCVVHNFIWCSLIPLVRAMHVKKDALLYEKSIRTIKVHNEPEEILPIVSVPLTSAVVELSMIDVHKSPLEMLNCLRTTYDLIFAETKLAMVVMISKYSDRELEIPIISDEEVIHGLAKTIVKSKMLHFYSNLFYMKFFGEKILENDHDLRVIVHSFEKAANSLLNYFETHICNKYQKTIRPGINVCEMMELLLTEEISNENIKRTIQSEQRKRMISLVKVSTTEKDLVPLYLPKVFT